MKLIKAIKIPGQIFMYLSHVQLEYTGGHLYWYAPLNLYAMV